MWTGDGAGWIFCTSSPAAFYEYSCLGTVKHTFVSRLCPTRQQTVDLKLESFAKKRFLLNIRDFFVTLFVNFDNQINYGKPMSLGRLEISQCEKEVLYSELVNLHLDSIPIDTHEELTAAIANLWALANQPNQTPQPQSSEGGSQRRVIRARTANPDHQRQDDVSDRAPSPLPHRRRNGLEQSLWEFANQPIEDLKDLLGNPAKYVPDHFEEFKQYVLDQIRKKGSELTARREAEDHAVIQLFDTISLPKKPNFDGVSSQEKATSCRRWLQEHASQLDAVKDIDLSNKRLRLIPKEIELFRNLRGLNLSNNEIETLNGIALPDSLQRFNLANNLIEAFEPFYRELRLWDNDYAAHFHSPCVESFRSLFALKDSEKRLLGRYLAKIRETQEYRSGGVSKAAIMGRIGAMLHQASINQAMDSLLAEALMHVQLWAWNIDHLELFHSPCVESFDLLFDLGDFDRKLLGQFLAKARETQEYRRGGNSKAALVRSVGAMLHQASNNIQARDHMMANAQMFVSLWAWNDEYQEHFYSPCMENLHLLATLGDSDKKLLGQFLAKVREPQNYRSVGNSEATTLRNIGAMLHQASTNLQARNHLIAEAQMYVQLWEWNDEHQKFFHSFCVENFRQLSTLEDSDKWLLGRYLTKIRETQEYRNDGASRATIVRRIGDMLHQASTNLQARDHMLALTQLYVRLREWNDEHLAFFHSFCIEESFRLLYVLEDSDKWLLGQYIIKIRETQDYRSSGDSKAAIVRRVGTMLRLASTNPQFRDQMVAAISEGVQACGDWTISVFNDIEILWKSYQENMTEEQVRALAIGQGRYELIKKIARRMVQERNLPTRTEAETILFFHLSLQRLFDLPFSTQGMLYPQFSNVTSEMVAEMTREVSQVSDEDLLEESPIWGRWQQEHHQPEIDRIKDFYAKLLEQAEELYSSDNRQEFLRAHEDLVKVLMPLFESDPPRDNYVEACALIAEERKKAIARAGTST